MSADGDACMNNIDTPTAITIRPIYATRTVAAICGLGLVIFFMGIAVGIYQFRGEREVQLVFAFIGALVSWTATVASCCLSKGPRLPSRLVVCGIAILFSTATSAFVGSDSIGFFAAFFFIIAFTAWLLAFALGFPSWRMANDSAPTTHSQYSIRGLMILTACVAVLFTVSQHMFPTRRDLIVLAILGVGGMVGWLLGCSSFCHRLRWWPLATLLLLSAACLGFWTILTNNDFGQPSGDVFEVSVVYPVASYLVPALIGRFTGSTELADVDVATVDEPVT